METEELKKKLDEAIEADAEEIQHTGEMIAGHPEIGFREFRTSEFVKNQLSELGLSVRSGMAITGLRADLPGAESRCRIAYFAELDALACHGHPQADPATGAAHACGHNIQMAVMLGVARAMMRTQAAHHLAGDIAFFAVPAEELGQIEYRNGLREEGKLSFLTGKQELIATGILDDIDMALMCHMQISKVAGKLVTVGATMNGALAKYIHYKGRAAHAGSAPHLGINALNAALLGLQAVHCLRETFREEDCIRVHPIITQGGALVNSVPDDVRLELFVRAKSVSALDETSRRVDRAFRAGADAIGAAAEISTLPGYMPLIPYPELDQVWAKTPSPCWERIRSGSARTSTARQTWET